MQMGHQLSKSEVKVPDEGWDRFPDAKIRMREDGLKTILDGLGPDGFCTATPARFHLLDGEVYIEMLLNVGKHGSIIALPLEVLIPVPAKLLVKPAKEKKNAVKKSVTPSVPPVVEPVRVIENLQQWDEIEAKDAAAAV